MREDWIEAELGMVCEIISGKNQKQVENSNGKYPIYGSGGVFGYANKYLCEAGTTVIGRKGTINNPIFVNHKFWIIDTAFGISPNTLLEKKYIHYLCAGFNFKKLDKSTTIPSLAKRDLLKINFYLAPLPEQRAIVAKIEQLFSELDNGIANLKTAKEKLVIYRQAVLKKAFEGEFNNAKIEWTTLGVVSNGVEYGTSSKSDAEGTIPVLRMGNIQNGLIDWTDLKFTSDADEIKKYRLYKNDVLFNRTNSSEHVGKSTIYKGQREAIFAGYLIRIHYKKDIVNGDYLNYFLNCHIAKKHGNKVKSFGVNQSNINGTKLKQYPFPKTSLKNQHAIVQEIKTRLSVCDNAVKNIDEALKKSEALRQSILKKAFEGKLLSKTEIEACKKEPDWEPASVLLEKIKNEKSIR